MAISSAICNTFKGELLEGKHNFASGGGHTFKIALYTSSANLGASTTAYSTSQEISNTSGSTAFVDFQDAQFTSASFTANGALIYNTTTAGGSGTTNAVCVLAFGGDFTASNGTFTIQFPTADTSNAIIRIS